MRILAVSLLMLMGHHTAWAQTPVAYQKERLIVHSEAGESTLLQVDVRDIIQTPQHDTLQLSGYSEGTGLLEIYPPNSPIRISPKSVMSAADIFVIDAYGTIVAVAPELVLQSLTLPIERAGLMRAILYTKAGLAETAQINVGDKIEYRIFETPPEILDTGSAGSADEEKARQIETQEKLGQQEAGVQALESSDAAERARRRPADNPEAKPLAKPNTNAARNDVIDELLKRHHQTQ